MSNRLRLAVALCSLAVGCGRDEELPAAGEDASSDGEQPYACGNQEPDPGELCDDGNLVKGDGCEPDCTFTCTTDQKCDDGDPCNGAETCTEEHTCRRGLPVDDGTPCGMDKACKGGVCGDVTCGDGFVQPPEECDDANNRSGDGCDACSFSCVATDPKRNCAPAPR